MKSAPRNLRALVTVVLALGLALGPAFGPGSGGLASAQQKEPDFVAPPGSDQAIPSPVTSSSLPADSGQLASDAVDVYRRTCLVAVGQASALVDAALGVGLAPFLGGAEGDANLASFLGDAPGQVYGLGNPADVMLAIGDDGQCTVWAQRADGPRLQQAFVAAMDALRAGGASVRVTRDRKVQRGGWRQQLGYDVSLPPLAFSADAVTLLTSQPGLQVLRASAGARRATPLPAAPAR